MPRFALALLVATAVAACGSRTSLPGLDEAPLGDAAPVDGGALADAAHDDAALRDASTRDALARTACPLTLPELHGWAVTDVRLGGDYEGLVAAAASDKSQIWLAGGGRASVLGATQLVRVEVVRGSPRIAETIVLQTTEGWAPLALAVSGARFALAARGASGEALVAVFAHDGTILHRATIDAVEIDLAYTLEADVAWAGQDLVVAMLRMGMGMDHFAVERRDASLTLLWSESLTPPPLEPASFRLRPDGSSLRTRNALRAVTPSGLGPASPSALLLAPLGAASTAWTGIDPTSFVLERDGAGVVRGGWPGGSFGNNGFIPVYESPTGIFILGNVDLGPFIGWFDTTELRWISIPHAGGSGVPYGDADNVGAFFAGIEIPHPDQPLRYWGCTR